MSLSTGHYQLASALKTLEGRWDETCKHWRDAVRRDFAQQHWSELESRIPSLLSAMNQLDQVLKRARQDCA